MNQDQVKELLLGLKSDVPDFSVTFTGKESKKVDGLYKPESREILLHNKNYSSDSRLIYTAIHEFAHHVHFSSLHRPNSTRAHTPLFYRILHELLQIAEKAGQYLPPDKATPELAKLAQTIREDVLASHGNSMVKLGEYLKTAFELCKKENVNYEDFLDRVISLDRNTAKLALRLSHLSLNPTLGVDNMKMLSKIRTPKERQEAQEMLESGGVSPDMIRSRFLQSVESSPVSEHLVPQQDQTINLISRKEVLEKNIQNLQKQLDAVHRALELLKNEDEI